MPFTLIPRHFHFGLPDPGMVLPDGYQFVSAADEFLCAREVETGRMFMPAFDAKDSPRTVTRLIRYRLLTAAEIAAHPHLPPRRFILDESEQILIAYDKDGIPSALAHTLAQGPEHSPSENLTK